jgi:hypothetical protein
MNGFSSALRAALACEELRFSNEQNKENEDGNVA